MKLEMICTGEEVLSGQIIDTNGAWFADTLMKHGIELQQRLIVGDRMEDLANAFRNRSQEADVILVNAGLGPTPDDLAAEAIAQVIGEPLVEDQAWRAHLENWFRQRGREMPDSNLKQCLLPRSATLIDNPTGSAPGFRLRYNDCWFFFTPGPPSEFHPMVENHVLPFLKATFPLPTETRLHKLLTLGHGESRLTDQLQQLTLPSGASLGYRFTMPYVEIKLFGRGVDAAAFDDCLANLRDLLGPAIVAENKTCIAQEVDHLLKESGATLSLAESCSGGMLSSWLVAIPGSSAYLHQSVVSYSNIAKQQLLGVSADILNNQGAVSPECAAAMAAGTRAIQNSDYGLSITGLAGPDGATANKSVGMVCIALCDQQQTWVQTVQLSRRSRQAVRTMSCALAFDMLRRALRQENPIVDYPFITRSEARHL